MLVLTAGAMMALTAVAQADPVRAGRELTAQAEPAPLGAARFFDIPAQPLAQALIRFSRDTGVELFISDAVAQGVQSAAVLGSFTPDEALRRMLEGGGLTYRRTNANTVTLEKRSEGGAVPGADGVVKFAPIAVEAQRLAAGRSDIGSPPLEYPGGQVARGGRAGLLGNRDIMDAPFSSASYTAQRIRDQQAATVADIVDGDPSVRSSASKGGILEAFFIRGFPIGEGNLGEVAFDGVYGVAPNYRVFSDYAERIEVLKGATALLYGTSPSNSVGGVINIVPKRAGDVDVTRLTADFTSAAQGGGGVDFSRRFGPGQELGVRVNGSYHGGDTPLDRQSREAFVGALALDYRGEKFKASLDFLNQQENFKAPSRPFTLAAGVATPSAPDGGLNVSPAWARSEVIDRSLLLRAEQEVNDAISLFANLGGGQTEVDRLSGQLNTILNTAGLTSSAPVRFKFEIERRIFDVGMRANFDTASVAHAVTFQGSRYWDRLSRASNSSAQTMFSNLYAPTNIPFISIAEPTRVPKASESELTGFAIADTASILDKRVQLTFGARQQRIESDNFNTDGSKASAYAKSVVTPMVGLVVKPWTNVSFYANHIEGLSRGDIAPSTALNAGQALAPYRATQQELGVKVDFGRIAATASLFQIEKPFGQLVGNVFSAGGEQRNRGLELSVFGEVAPDLRLLAGVTLLDAEMVKTNTAATRGNRPIGVPTTQANLSAEWDAPFAAGLTLGGGMIFTGGQYVDAANTQSIPSWVRFDLGLRYATRLMDRPTTFRLGVQNVFDANYWSGVASSYGGLGQGAPRTALFSITTDF